MVCAEFGLVCSCGHWCHCVSPPFPASFTEYPFLTHNLSLHPQAPLQTLVKRDEFLFLTEKSSLPLPIPPVLHNDGNYIISLGQLCRWLAAQAEELGVEIYPGFSASEVRGRMEARSLLESRIWWSLLDEAVCRM
jgi:flavin-dependent dehydrogenase